MTDADHIQACLMWSGRWSAVCKACTSTTSPRSDTAWITANSHAKSTHLSPVSLTTEMSPFADTCVTNPKTAARPELSNVLYVKSFKLRFVIDFVLRPSVYPTATRQHGCTQEPMHGRIYAGKVTCPVWTCRQCSRGKKVD